MQITLRLGLRTWLCTILSVLTMFGTAFQDAQRDENLGIVKAIVLRNRVELLEHELVDVSQKIEEM